MVLIASSGEYYRLAVLARGHKVLLVVPSGLDIIDLLKNQEEDIDEDRVMADLKTELVVSAWTPAERDQQRLLAKQIAEIAEKEKQKVARDARAEARRKRQAAMSKEQGLNRHLSEIVVHAGEPPYSDDRIEAYHNINRNFQQGRRKSNPIVSVIHCADKRISTIQSTRRLKVG